MTAVAIALAELFSRAEQTGYLIQVMCHYWRAHTHTHARAQEFFNFIYIM